MEYMAAFTQVVLPIGYEYNPELVIVSAGFDACVGDPLGGNEYTFVYKGSEKKICAKINMGTS